MAFDQNSVPRDLRPLNIARIRAEEARVLPATTAGRNAEGFLPNSVREVSSPSSVPLIYPAPLSDAGFVSMGYGNMQPGVAAWCPRMPVPIGNPSMNPALGFCYSSNLVNRVGGGISTDHANSAMATGPGYAQNLGNWVGGNSVDQVVTDPVTEHGCSPSVGNRVNGNGTAQLSNIPTSGIDCSPNFARRPSGNEVEKVSDEGGDESFSGRKVKFLCSFGGKILPRPSDGMLRYVGGQTRIISVKRDVSFSELVQKMVNTYGQPVVIKYQLPDEDLDALVSVSCPDDLDNMMDEYEKLIERSTDGSSKLRRYVDAVNGIMDGVSGAITRKASVASATSTQNSDFSGTEPLDNSIPGQRNTSGALSSSMLSPRENAAAPHDIAAKLGYLDHCPEVHSDASGVPSSKPVAKSGPAHTSPSLPEVELERVGPHTLLQKQLGLQQAVTNIPPPASYLQPLVNPRQEVMYHSDYVQLPPHMGFPNPQVLGKAGPVFTQQQFPDNTAGLAPHQFIPAVQMTMTPPTSHIGIRSNVVQPLMQHQQSQLDPYADESTYGQSIVQIPAEQSYNAYQGQVSTGLVGGNYSWHQIPPPEHVIFPDGWVHHQQGQKDIGASPVSDSNTTYHSLCLEDNFRAPAMKRVMVTGGFKGGAVEQGVLAQHRVTGNMDQQVVIPPTDPRNSVLWDVNGRAGDKQSPNDGYMGNLPQTARDDAVHQHMVRAENHKQEMLVNNLVNCDIPPVGCMSVQTLEYILQESPKAYSDKLPGIVSKEDAVGNCNTYDHLGPIDGKMETLRIYNPEIHVNDDLNKFLVDKAREVDNFDHKHKQVVERDMLLDNNFGRSRISFDGNQSKTTEMLPCPSREVLYEHGSRPLEYNEVAQPPGWGNRGLYPQANIGNHLDSNEVRYVNPAFNGVDLGDKTASPVECKDDTGKLFKMVNNNPEVVASSGTMTSSSSPSGRNGDVQDTSNSLFSNQDPWSLRHETYFPPPRPNKVPSKKEPIGSMVPFGENLSGNCREQISDVQLQDSSYLQLMNSKQDSDHAQSKGSAEEQIKKELQAVAEGVAASVLLLSIPSNADMHDKNKSSFEDVEFRDVQNNFAERQHKARVQDVDTNPPENANLGFPVVR
ncbi:Phox/Bem1p [Quillaja saponaria]|uniref:Phox/Bem1p n=1 Tax=Quillaja saponaria TaxID=32244 RepID=A0AAD7PJH3_QUISA|nr:Phox/Bem1p [Quillaja saponaria]